MLMLCAGGVAPLIAYANDNELGATLKFASAAATLKVKFWVALGITPLLAVMVNGKVFEFVGVPTNAAVPFPLSAKVKPPGSVPHMDNAGVGVPVAITVNDPGAPTLKSAELALVIAGAV